MYPPKTLAVLAAFAGALLVARTVPPLGRFLTWDPANVATVWDMPVKVAPIPVSKLNKVAIVDRRGKGAAQTPEKGDHLTDPHNALDHFYAALLDHGSDGVVRVLHFGDSPTTADLVTGDVRAMLQQEFGDAGTGFALIAKPWAWYNHRGLEMSSSDWRIEIGGAGKIKDGLFGIGGVTFLGSKNAEAKWRLKDGQHRRAEIAYWATPGGGTFSFLADGKEIGTRETAAEVPSQGFAEFELPEGSTRFSLAVTEGRVRLFGVEFRKESPGILYSSLGVNGAGVTMLSKNANKIHLAAQLQHYQPDLVVIAYGTNEAGYPSYVDSNWSLELRKALERIREASPQTSLLLMSPMDRGELNDKGDIVTTPALMRLIARERQVAEEEGVAFFNTFEAMGGEGTMARWFAAQPRIVGSDFIHPLPAGGRIVGSLLYQALQTGFQGYKLRRLNENSGNAGTAGPDGGPPGAEIGAEEKKTERAAER